MAKVPNVYPIRIDVDATEAKRQVESLAEAHRTLSVAKADAFVRWAIVALAFSGAAAVLTGTVLAIVRAFGG